VLEPVEKHSVMRGLAPRINAFNGAPRQMDYRVKPGNDGGGWARRFRLIKEKIGFVPSLFFQVTENKAVFSPVFLFIASCNGALVRFLICLVTYYFPKDVMNMMHSCMDSSDGSA
jgi:hypothetical protein